MKDVVFSIVIPVYKIEDYLPMCVDSILSQSFDRFELILVDDGSPDNCSQICDKYALKDNRIKVIHKKNGGPVSARNAGMKVARGKYICNLDGDDYVSQNMLETIYEKGIREYDSDIIVYGAVRQYVDEQIEIPNFIEEGFYGKDRLKKEIYPKMMYDDTKPFFTPLVFPVTWNKAFKRELVLEHFCKEETIRMGEDGAFTYECLYNAGSVFFCKDILYYYNQMNTVSMVHSYYADRFKNNKLLLDYIEKNLGGREEVIDYQINAFKTYWLAMAVFHEVKCKIPFFQARRHLKAGIKQYQNLKEIKNKGLPAFAKVFIILLKCRLYGLTLILSKFINRRRRKKLKY